MITEQRAQKCSAEFEGSIMALSGAKEILKTLNLDLAGLY
jgi:hypothetical protein